MEKEKTKNDNFLDACKNAFSGVWHSIKTQINVKIQIVIAIMVIILSIYLKIEKTELLFIIGAIFLVIVTEILNTAIETCVDLITTKYHPKAKIAKDVGAGAVLIASIHAIIVGIIVFYDKVLSLFN